MSTVIVGSAEEVTAADEITRAAARRRAVGGGERSDALGPVRPEKVTGRRTAPLVAFVGRHP